MNIYRIKSKLPITLDLMGRKNTFKPDEDITEGPYTKFYPSEFTKVGTFDRLNYILSEPVFNPITPISKDIIVEFVEKENIRKKAKNEVNIEELFEDVTIHTEED